MATIVNQRDKTLQTAERRTVVVEDPGAIVIPGYTGITLTKDPTMFVATFGSTSPWLVSPARMVITARLQGIPPNTPVTWELGDMVVLNPNETYSVANPLRQEFRPMPTTIILTDTPDPMIKTVEASNYPRAGVHEMRWYQSLPKGHIQVSVNYGGQVFKALTNVVVFTG